MAGQLVAGWLGRLTDRVGRPTDSRPKVPNKKVEDIRWVFQSIADQSRARLAFNHTYTMVDVGQKSGAITVQQVLCLKKQIKEYCESTFVTSLGFSARVCTQIIELIHDHEAFRSKMGWRHVSNCSLDKSWQKEWTESTHRCVHLLASIIFYRDHDGILKQCVKNNKTAEQSLSYSATAFVYTSAV